MKIICFVRKEQSSKKAFCQIKKLTWLSNSSDSWTWNQRLVRIWTVSHLSSTDKSMHHSISPRSPFYGILSHFHYFLLNMTKFTYLEGTSYFFHFCYIPFIGSLRETLLSNNNSSQYSRSPCSLLQNTVYKIFLALWNNQKLSFKFYDTEARSSIKIFRSRRDIQMPSEILIICCWDI